MTLGPGIEPRPHCCEASAPTTAPSIAFLLMTFVFKAGSGLNYSYFTKCSNSTTPGRHSAQCYHFYLPIAVGMNVSRARSDLNAMREMKRDFEGRARRTRIASVVL